AESDSRRWIYSLYFRNFGSDSGDPCPDNVKRESPRRGRSQERLATTLPITTMAEFKLNRRAWMGSALLLSDIIMSRATGANESPGGLRAGVAEVSITPSWSTSLWGYDNVTRATRGVRDEIFAKAFLFDWGKQFLVITMDLGAIGLPLRRRIARRIHETIKIDEDAIMMQVTHDHSAPATLDIPSTPADVRFQQLLEDRLVQVATAARHDLAPAALAYGSRESLTAVTGGGGARQNTWKKASGQTDSVRSVLMLTS